MTDAWTRRTITLDPDTTALVEKEMRARGRSFEHAAAISSCLVGIDLRVTHAPGPGSKRLGRLRCGEPAEDALDDHHLAALARQDDATVVSYDNDFAGSLACGGNARRLRRIDPVDARGIT